MAEKSKGNLALVSAETERLRKEFGETFQRANKGQPKPGDVERLRRMLDDHPDLKLWERYIGVMSCAEAYVLQQAPAGLQAFAEVWRPRLANIRKKLGYQDAPEIEKLLIQHAALCWLRLGLIEIQLAGYTRDSHTLASGAYWDRRLTNAQRRFTRAVETLAKVRALAAVAERARGARGTLPAARTGTAS